MKSTDWTPLTLEGPIVSGDLEGLIGIEELSSYDSNAIIKGKSKKRGVKRKASEDEKVLSKKINTTSNAQKREPGAFVRNPNYNPLNKNKVSEVQEVTNIETKSKKKSKKKKKKVMKENESSSESTENDEICEDIAVTTPSKTNFDKKKKKKSNKIPKTKTEIGVKTKENINCTTEDLKAWDFVRLPEPVMKGLAELGFTKPTPIQELTLPAAIFGRRDILGAAETGSGKTLAFGLPILCGILQLKKNEAKDKNEDIKIEFENINDGQNSDDDSDEEQNINNGLDDEGDNENESDEDGVENESQVEEDIEEDLSDVSELSEENDESTDVNEETVEIISKKMKPLYALVLTPTRELAVQVKNHLEAIAKHAGIHVAVVVGGMAAVKQERILSKGPEIVVATPGRLWELIQQGNRHLSQIDNIRFLAIDETDRMLEKGHFAELHQLLERLNLVDWKKEQRQNFVFSATLTLVHDLPAHLLAKKRINAKKNKKIFKMTPQQKLNKVIEMLGITNPKIVDVTKEKATAENLTECRITCGLEEKDFYVYYFLKRHPGRTLIFCNSIGCVKRLATLLGLLNCGALPLHASMQQRQRLKNLERFRDDPCAVLVSTDVAARGLDIPDVEHVLHYQTPRTVESYVHRSGRTARALQQGITVLLIEPGEIINYRRLCLTLNRTEDLPSFPIEERYLNAVKERVRLARELDKLELKTKRINSENGWLQKAAQEMDLVVDDSENSENEDLKESNKIKREATVRRKQLAALLAKQIFPKGMSYKYPTINSSLNIPLAPEEEIKMKAIDVMKSELENNAKKRKQKVKKLFKPKPTIAEKRKEKKVLKAVAKRKKRKLKKERLGQQS